MYRRLSNKGFSLTEIVISLAVGSIAALAIAHIATQAKMTEIEVTNRNVVDQFHYAATRSARNSQFIALNLGIIDSNGARNLSLDRCLVGRPRPGDNCASFARQAQYVEVINAEGNRSVRNIITMTLNCNANRCETVQVNVQSRIENGTVTPGPPTRSLIRLPASVFFLLFKPSVAHAFGTKDSTPFQQHLDPLTQPIISPGTKDPIRDPEDPTPTPSATPKPPKNTHSPTPTPTPTPTPSATPKYTSQTPTPSPTPGGHTVETPMPVATVTQTIQQATPTLQTKHNNLSDHDSYSAVQERSSSSEYPASLFAPLEQIRFGNDAGCQAGFVMSGVDLQTRSAVCTPVLNGANDSCPTNQPMRTFGRTAATCQRLVASTCPDGFSNVGLYSGQTACSATPSPTPTPTPTPTPAPSPTPNPACVANGDQVDSIVVTPTVFQVITQANSGCCSGTSRYTIPGCAGYPSMTCEEVDVVVRCRSSASPTPTPTATATSTPTPTPTASPTATPVGCSIPAMGTVCGMVGQTAKCCDAMGSERTTTCQSDKKWSAPTIVLNACSTTTAEPCPTGSSPTGTGAQTDVIGCKCNAMKPVFDGTACKPDDGLGSCYNCYPIMNGTQTECHVAIDICPN